MHDSTTLCVYVTLRRHICSHKRQKLPRVPAPKYAPIAHCQHLMPNVPFTTSLYRNANGLRIPIVQSMWCWSSTSSVFLYEFAQVYLPLYRVIGVFFLFLEQSLRFRFIRQRIYGDCYFSNLNFQRCTKKKIFRTFIFCFVLGLWFLHQTLWQHYLNSRIEFDDKKVRLFSLKCTEICHGTKLKFRKAALWMMYGLIYFWGKYLSRSTR